MADEINTVVCASESFLSFSLSKEELEMGDL